MKVCIFGSGATGGYLGVELARAGAEVSLVARGAHLEAIRRNGLKLLIDGEERVAHAPATDDPKELGPQDYVIIGLKAHSIPGAVDTIAPLLGNDTAVVTASNGIPYWYFHDHGGGFKNTVLQTVDPDGKQWQVLKPERAIGCIVYPATEVVEPGVIKHVYGNKFPLGEPSGERTERVERLSQLMTARVPGSSAMTSSVAWVSALIGLKHRLPQSFSQISSRMRSSTGASNPAAVMS